MTAEIIPLFPEKSHRKCSFCKTPEVEAKKFIASDVTSHCICGACVILAKQMIQQTEKPNA